MKSAIPLATICCLSMSLSSNLLFARGGHGEAPEHPHHAHNAPAHQGNPPSPPNHPSSPPPVAPQAIVSPPVRNEPVVERHQHHHENQRNNEANVNVVRQGGPVFSNVQPNRVAPGIPTNVPVISSPSQHEHHLRQGITGSPQLGHHPGVVNTLPAVIPGNPANVVVPRHNVIGNVPTEFDRERERNFQHVPNEIGRDVERRRIEIERHSEALRERNERQFERREIREERNERREHQIGNNFIGGPERLEHPRHEENRFHEREEHRGFIGSTIRVGNLPITLGAVSYQPSYVHHAHHYHGYWNGNRGYGSGYRYGVGIGYGYRPCGWGLGGWGLGSLNYGSGYLGYTNPYYTNIGLDGYNYAQPIPVNYNPSVVVVNSSNGLNSRNEAMDAAVAAFRQNDYDLALDFANRGIRQFPDDAVLHEFRALALFARGDYQQAAATIHAVLAVGPGWDWTTLSGLYTDVNQYTIQLRTLESAIRQNPQDGALRFLLAYHYLSDGFSDAAIRQLQRVVELVPNDRVANDLLRMLLAPASGSPVQEGQPVPQPPTDLSPSDLSLAPPVDLRAIIGDWSASRNDGSSFALSLGADRTFTWTFTPIQQPPQSFEGVYRLEGNVVVLERTGGGSLVGQITQADGFGFNFRMVGAPNEDPGLDFRK